MNFYVRSPEFQRQSALRPTYVIGHDGSGLVACDGLVGQTPGTEGGLSISNGKKERTTGELQGNHD